MFLAEYEVFALQNGGQCATSADALTTYKRYGVARNCGNDGEGGAWANQVYRIKGLPTFYFWPNVCFVIYFYFKNEKKQQQKTKKKQKTNKQRRSRVKRCKQPGR